MDRGWKAYKDLLYGVKVSIYSVMALTLFILLWHLISMFYEKPYIPSPFAVGLKIYLGFSQGYMVADTILTMSRVFTAILIAFIAGLFTGIIAGRTAMGSRAMRPIIIATHPIPHVTLIPILLWIFGIEWSKIAVISIITYYPIAISTMEWALRTPKEYEDLIDSMGGRAVHKIFYVVLPHVLPGLLTGLRIAVSTAYAVVFIAESFVLSGGLGAYIEDSWHRLDYAGVYAGVVLLSLLGLVSYSAIWLIENIVRNRYQ